MGWALLIQAALAARPGVQTSKASVANSQVYHGLPGIQDYPEAQKQLAAVGCPEPLLYYCSIVIFGVACNEERVAAPVN